MIFLINLRIYQVRFSYSEVVLRRTVDGYLAVFATIRYCRLKSPNLYFIIKKYWTLTKFTSVSISWILQNKDLFENRVIIIKISKLNITLWSSLNSFFFSILLFGYLLYKDYIIFFYFFLQKNFNIMWFYFVLYIL